MPAWLFWICVIFVLLTAAYLVSVILRPEAF